MLFRFVARFARVRIEDSSRNRFALNDIFSGGFYPDTLINILTTVYIDASLMYKYHRNSIQQSRPEVIRIRTRKYRHHLETQKIKKIYIKTFNARVGFMFIFLTWVGFIFPSVIEFTKRFNQKYSCHTQRNIF